MEPTDVTVDNFPIPIDSFQLFCCLRCEVVDPCLNYGVKIFAVLCEEISAVFKFDFIMRTALSLSKFQPRAIARMR